MPEQGVIDMPRGGARKGAGRPPTGRTTKVIRVPEDFPEPEKLSEVIKVLKTWKQELNSNPKRPDSVRWKNINKLLEEIESIDPNLLNSN